MKAPFVLRAATQADAPAMERCARRAYAEALSRIDGLPDVTGDMTGELTRLSGCVAEINGTLAGFVLFAPRVPDTKIVNLASDPDVAGRGVARALLDHVAQKARAAGATRMELVTHAEMTGSRAFYRYLGWTEAAQVEHAVVFTKTL